MVHDAKQSSACKATGAASNGSGREKAHSPRNSLSAEPAGDITVTSSSPDAPLDAAEQHATIQPTEQGQRSALLFMLKDLEAGRKQVEQAHHEWINALDVVDVVDDTTLLHDKELRISAAATQNGG